MPAASPAPSAVVGVVGAGTMGAGIAQVALEHGHEVRLFDVDAAAVERGMDAIRAGLSRRSARAEAAPGVAPAAGGSTLTERVHRALERLVPVGSLQALGRGADVVIEAALEDLTTKRAVFAELDEATPDAILATNTSALSVGAIAAATRRPGRVLGLHFFNPAPVMVLVEVVPTSDTDPRVISIATSLVAGWGKTPISAADAPGFIVNRVNRPFTLEALAMLETGVADVLAIDRAIRAAGFPMGPFELMDLVGVDVNLASTRAIHDAFASRPEAERFAPSPIQSRLVAEGRLGRKVGRGFYAYDAEGRAARPAEAAGTLDPDGALPAERIVERVVVAIAAEACRAAAAGVAAPADIDVAMRLGASHPTGPFEWIESIGGPIALRRRLDALARYGARFSTPLDLT